MTSIASTVATESTEAQNGGGTYSVGAYPGDTGEENNISPPYAQPYWIPCEAILSSLTLFSVYVFMNVLRYTLTRKSSPGRDMSGKQGRRLHMMCILASGLAVLRFCSDHAVAFLGWRGDEHCFITVTVSTIFFALSLLSIYIFLWMRQSIFYSNPVLSKVLNKGITVLSWSTLVAMLLCGICLSVLYNLPQITGYEYKATGQGCVEVSDGVVEVVPAITLVVTIYFQISLLGLFLYPLLSRKTQRYRSAGKGATTNNEDTNQNSYTQHQSSVSNNTDDNLTDGDYTLSNSAQSPKMKIEQLKSYDLAESENESGVDVHGPSDKSSESSAGIPNGVHPIDSKKKKHSIDSTTSKGSLPNVLESSDTEKLKQVRQKRSSLLRNTRFFKTGSLFYKRHESKMGNAAQSPAAKRTRAKTVASVSMKIENQESVEERKMSNASTKRRKMRRHTKRTQQGRRMMEYLKKTFFLMMVCVITDAVATVLQDVTEVPELVYLVIFDISLMVNIICIILSFRDWDVILFPICARKKTSGNGSTYEASKSSVKGDTNAAKRRADVLRSVKGKTYDYAPELNSPVAVQYHRDRLGKKHSDSFSTPGTDSGKEANVQGRSYTVSTPQSCLINKNFNLNGKT